MLGTAIRRPTGWQAAGGATLIVAGFVVGVIVAVAIVLGPRAQPGSGTLTTGAAAVDPTATALGTYRQTLANLDAAVRRHDWHSVARFRLQLDNQMTTETIHSIYAQRSRLLGNLAAAEDRHDQRMAVAFRQQLTALCPSVEVSSAPAFCQ